MLVTEFKLAVLVYKALNGLSAQYLADDCHLPAADDFDRPPSPCVMFQELAQVCAIAHLLMPDHVCGMTYLSVYVILKLLS